MRVFTVQCPKCQRKLGPFGAYRPGLIRCAHCGTVFNLR